MRNNAETITVEYKTKKKKDTRRKVWKEFKISLAIPCIIIVIMALIEKAIGIAFFFGVFAFLLLRTWKK